MRKLWKKPQADQQVNWNERKWETGGGGKSGKGLQKRDGHSNLELLGRRSCRFGGSMNQHRGVLVGRDGVIYRQKTRGCAKGWREIGYLPRALEGLRLLRQAGFTVVLVSREECVADGEVSQWEFESMTRRLALDVALEHGQIANSYYCGHRAGEQCFCRRPAPGLLLRAMQENALSAQETTMVGNSAEDAEAARRAGCGCILIRRGAFLTEEVRQEDGDEVASSLYEAAERLAGTTDPRTREYMRQEAECLVAGGGSETGSLMDAEKKLA